MPALTIKWIYCIVCDDHISRASLVLQTRLDNPDDCEQLNKKVFNFSFDVYETIDNLNQQE